MGFCHASMETGNGAITYELNALQLRSICPSTRFSLYFPICFFFPFALKNRSGTVEKFVRFYALTNSICIVHGKKIRSVVYLHHRDK